MSALHPDTGLRRPAIFLDRDGVINENRADHVTSWADFALVPGALAGLRALTTLGLPLVVVTNQAIVGRGQITAEALNDLHASMRTLLAQHGCPITAVYACPHRPEDGCGCRKPQPGLLFRAAREHNLDLGSSYYVGDALTDIAAGQAAGCTAVVVRTGRGLSQTLREQARSYSGYYVAHNLRHAAWCIAHDCAQRKGRDTLRSRLERWRLALHGVRFV